MGRCLRESLTYDCAYLWRRCSTNAVFDSPKVFRPYKSRRCHRQILRERIRTVGISILGANSGLDGSYELGIESIKAINPNHSTQAHCESFSVGVAVLFTDGYLVLASVKVWTVNAIANGARESLSTWSDICNKSVKVQFINSVIDEPALFEWGIKQRWRYERYVLYKVCYYDGIVGIV